jgi:hypothetical protein
MTPEVTTAEHVETATAARTEAPTESDQQPTSGAGDAAGPIAQTDASSNNVGAAKAVEMSVVAVLGLATAGLLFRIAVKIAGAHRRKVIVNRSESHWLNDPNEHEPRHKQPESARQRERLIEELDWMHQGNEHDFRDGEQRSRSVEERITPIDDVEGLVTLTASDDTLRQSLRNGDELLDTIQRRDRAPDVADEIRKREDTLAQLKRDLDRLLQSPKVA